ncbi:hypothetical protein CHLNCDRAFT_139174 [Chlorella variabilis]|uniref:Uncharacterized protein n=1 Tax=Chlorella variabilis TaxID=554065 RepID=E1ZPE4_CHLVA|nr:hypothetical protein CHLNCDRAFT_139174 [Chlorella variabilis]EFN52261.1 hypothetical protein CHLNCDRAFT_139174 [Chlorella variabilis]|eukprot:XP_005844363.1 hypothetical protein CHLNCDRAFT_139174 [Chlorella variabilis]
MSSSKPIGERLADSVAATGEAAGKAWDATKDKAFQTKAKVEEIPHRAGEKMEHAQHRAEEAGHEAQHRATEATTTK